MARKASVRYYDSRRGYFTFYKGTQHKLAQGDDDAPDGPCYRAACRAFLDLMELGQADTAGQANLVRTVFELYAQNLETRGKTRTLSIFRQVADHAANAFGDMSVEKLKPFHVDKFLLEMRKPRIDSYGRKVQWSDKPFALNQLAGAFNWAKQKGLITDHCLGKVDREKPVSKGEEAYVSKQDYDRIMSKTNQNFRDLLSFMRDTGCRPNEAYHVEARYYNREDKCVIYKGRPQAGEYVWKNARKTKRDRVIYLTDELAAMVEQRIVKYPTGPIFLTKQKSKWSRESVGIALRWLTAKLNEEDPKLKMKVPTAYGLRHAFATDWLLAAGSIKILADLMGTSVTMIERHYSHVEINRPRMRGVMLDVLARRTCIPSPVA